MDAVLRLHRMWLKNPSEGCQADLRGAKLNDQNFTGEDLRRLIAEGASLRESRFYDCDLGAGNFDGADFYHVRLHHSGFREIQARAANFAGARLDHCDFSGASLAQANFFRAEMNQCIFRDADLEGCDLREVRMRGGDFRGANLRGSKGLSGSNRTGDQGFEDDLAVALWGEQSCLPSAFEPTPTIAPLRKAAAATIGYPTTPRRLMNTPAGRGSKRRLN